MNVVGDNLWAGVPVAEHLALFSPLIALTATMLAVVLCPVIVGRNTRAIAGVAVVGVIATFVLTIGVARSVATGGSGGLSPDGGSGMLIADNLSIGFQILLVGFLGAVIWLWWMGSAPTERDAPEFFILLLGSALGMALMASTANLLMIVIAIEMASLPSYAIVGFDKRNRNAAEASLKYMVFGAISAAIMLYGASLLYGFAQSLNTAVIGEAVLRSFSNGDQVLLCSIGLLCFVGGIAFKISAVPFHFWCPDAFEGARIEITTWLSVASKAAGLVLLVRLVMVFTTAAGGRLYVTPLGPLSWAIAIMATITCTYANFTAYRQRSVKRLLAYSSIAHAGYMLMAAAVFIYPEPGGVGVGASALLAYVLIYLFMNLGAFGVVALVVWDTGSDRIEAFSGLMRRAPWIAVPMVVCLMSLVGLPPLAGFMGKWWVLMALGRMNNTVGWMLVVVLSVNTLFSLYYYMRLVVIMALRDDGQPTVRSPIGGLAIVNVCAAMLLVLFIWQARFKGMADHFASRTFQPTRTVAISPSTGHLGARADQTDARSAEARFVEAAAPTADP
ncbi:MAG: NADH-quinone oxidoreductase subunit N [Phycisphaerae bacterium]